MDTFMPSSFQGQRCFQHPDSGTEHVTLMPCFHHGAEILTQGSGIIFLCTWMEPGGRRQTFCPRGGKNWSRAITNWCSTKIRLQCTPSALFPPHIRTCDAGDDLGYDSHLEFQLLHVPAHFPEWFFSQNHGKPLQVPQTHLWMRWAQEEGCRAVGAFDTSPRFCMNTKGRTGKWTAVLMDALVSPNWPLTPLTAGVPPSLGNAATPTPAPRTKGLNNPPLPHQPGCWLSWTIHADLLTSAQGMCF